jgi:hypothetical protein
MGCFIGSLYHQFIRSAYYRSRKTCIRTDLAKIIHDGRIGNMPAIPGKQKIHPLHSGNGNVSSVCRSLLRNQACRQYCLHQFFCISGELQDRNISQNAFSCLGGRWITSARFHEDQGGHMQMVAQSPLVPPITGCLLLPSDYDIATRPSGQQAWDCGFEVNLWLHGFTVVIPPKSLPGWRW